MDYVSFVRLQLTNARETCEDALKGISDETFTWVPPGTGNAICSVYLHTVTTEDYYFHTLLQQKPMIWMTGDWGNKLDIEMTADSEQRWQALKNAHPSLAQAQAYAQAVYAATDVYLATLSVEEMQRMVTSENREKSVAGWLSTPIYHTSLHAGEIAALRGMHGEKGLPY